MTETVDVRRKVKVLLDAPDETRRVLAPIEQEVFDLVRETAEDIETAESDR